MSLECMVKNVVDQDGGRSEGCQEEEKIQCGGCATPDLQSPRFVPNRDTERTSSTVQHISVVL